MPVKALTAPGAHLIIPLKAARSPKSDSGYGAFFPIEHR